MDLSPHRLDESLHMRVTVKLSGAPGRWGTRVLTSPQAEASTEDVRRGLVSVPQNAPFLDLQNSLTGHVCPI